VSVLSPPCSLMAETSVQVPTRSLAVCANASPAARTTPSNSHPSVPRVSVHTRFMVLLPCPCVLRTRYGRNVRAVLLQPHPCSPALGVGGVVMRGQSIALGMIPSLVPGFRTPKDIFQAFFSSLKPFLTWIFHNMSSEHSGGNPAPGQVGSVPITRHRLKRSPTADKRLWIPQAFVASHPNNSSRCRGPELDDG